MGSRRPPLELQHQVIALGADEADATAQLVGPSEHQRRTQAFLPPRRLVVRPHHHVVAGHVGEGARQHGLEGLDQRLPRVS